MNLRRIVRLGSATLMVAPLATSALHAQTPYSGLHPRGAASDYSISAQTAHATYAAALIPTDQVKSQFSADVSRKFLVFELAVYPTSSTAIGPGDVLGKSGSHGDFVRPVNAATVIASVSDHPPSRLPENMPNIQTQVGVGYESGTDPVTGRRVHGTYTQAGVSADNYPNRSPNAPPRSGTTPQDRINLEDDLSDKSFPQGSFTAPVAGYLYFAASELKKANGVYELQLLNDPPAKTVLLVPVRKK